MPCFCGAIYVFKDTKFTAEAIEVEEEEEGLLAKQIDK